MVKGWGNPPDTNMNIYFPFGLKEIHVGCESPLPAPTEGRANSFVADDGHVVISQAVVRVNWYILLFSFPPV